MEGISRREFLKYAGASAGVAAIAGSGVMYYAPRMDELDRASRGASGAAGRWSDVPPDLSARLQALLDELVERKDHHHAVLALESGDGSFGWSGAAGQAHPNGEEMTPETPFFIASIDKLYVATAVMHLYEKGALDLSAPIAEYLPTALTDGIHVLDGVDHSAAVTVRHLLSHTSGLADYLEDSPKDGAPLVEQILAEGDRDWGIEDTVRLLRKDLAPHFAPQPLDGAKVKARYSDTNYQLLIELVESLEGKTLDAVLEDLLFLPFGMRQTYLEGLSEPADAAVAPASLWFGEEVIQLPRFLKGLRSIYSTTADQISSARAIISGEVFENPSTVGSMQQWNSLPFPTDRAAMRAPGWPVRYGYGMQHFELPRLFTGMRRVPPAIGHTGSTGSWLFYCPELDVYLAGTVDQGTAGAVPYRVVPKILRILGEAAS